MQNITNSNWKVLSEFPKYAITPEGQVWSFRRNRFLKPYQGPDGYLRVNLCNDLGQSTCNIHRLVGKAFIPLPPEFNGNYDTATIDHIDGNKLNNHYTNLEWVTRGENTSRAWDNGLCDNLKKPCFCVSIEDKKYTPFDSLSDMDRSLNLPEGTISRAIIRTNGILQGKYIVGYTKDLDQKYLLPKPDAVGIIQLYSDAIDNFMPHRKNCFLIDSLDNTYKAYKTFNSCVDIDKHLNLPIGTATLAIHKAHGLIRGRYIAGYLDDPRWKKILPKCTVKQIVALYADQIERYKQQRGSKKITNLKTGESETYESLAEFAREHGLDSKHIRRYLENHPDLYKVEPA